MNSDFVIRQAKALAARTTDEPSQDNPKERIRRLYRTALARDPDAEEMEAAAAFVDPESVRAFRSAHSDSGDLLDPWVQLAQVLLLCNEFAFVD